MTLLKIALTLLGTVGLTAGTVLAVAEPTPEPLPKPALTSACSSCKTTATKCATEKCATEKCSKSACAASDACKTKAVSLDSCVSKCGDKADCTSKVSKTTACPKTSPVSTTADSAKECSKDKCSKDKCSKTACSKKDSEAQVSLNKECAGASSCKKNQAKACEKACEADAKVAACSKNSCKTQPVSTNACATGAAGEKSACAEGKCTEAVSTKAPCSASKCKKAVSTKAACEASKCTEAVATSTKCEAAKCGPSKCTAAVSTKADCSKKACEKDACSTKACSAECGKKCEGKCESCPCKGKSECENGENVVNTKSYRAGHVVGVGVNSDSGVVGKVIFTGSLEAGTCETASSARENGECKGHTVYGINFNSMKPSIERRTVYVTNCSRCREACEGHADHDIVATSCEAKPACITSECPVAACAADAGDACACSACDRENCQGDCACEERELARNSEPASASCDRCDQCQCGTCACDGAMPSMGAAPGVSHVGHVRFEHFAPGAGTVFGWSSQFMNDGPHGPHAPPAGWMPSHDAYAHDMVHFHPEQELPGRIRLMTVMPQMSPGRHPHLPPAMRFPTPHPGMAMSSFGMPVSAAMPPHRPESRRPATIEGTWSRTFGDETIVFTCEDGRLWGRMEGGSLEFSGTCSISEDGQIFGLIDNVEAPHVPAKFTSWLVDQPFAVRFRLDGGDLIVKDFRCADLPTTIEHDDKEIPFADGVRSFVCGRFTPTDAAH